MLAGKGLNVERNKGNINDCRCRKGQQTMKNGGWLLVDRRDGKAQNKVEAEQQVVPVNFAGSHHYLFIYLFIFG